MSQNLNAQQNTQGGEKSRLHFNWGYHDAAADAKRGRLHKWPLQIHPNGSYLSGYNAGFADALTGMYAGDSDAAWALAA